MIFKALKMGFVENKGQSGPLPVVSTTKGSGANVSCQLNFRLFVSCQLTPSRPSNNSPFKQSYFSLSIIRALPYSNVQIMRVLLLKSVCGTRNNCRSILRCQWNTRGTKALLKVFKHKKKILPQGMSLYPPKIYWSFCMMVTVLCLPSHLLWKVLALQPCEVAL